MEREEGVVVDIASILGLGLCIIFVFVSIVIGDQGLPAILNFVDAPSAMITFGGSFCAILAAYTTSEYIAGLKSISLIFKTTELNMPEVIRKIIELSNVARKEGLLSLEEASAELDDAFLKKGVLLIVDGTDPELVRAIMETELTSVDSRHRKKIAFWDDLGTMGPAWGMIGTLIGLINMLQMMNDPSSIGPQMSIALLTTLYGSMLANWICAPVASKLKTKNENEMIIKEIMIEGLLSIQAGENPRIIEEKLKSFLTPVEKASMEEAGGEMDG